MNAACRIEAQHRRKLTLANLPRKLGAWRNRLTSNPRHQRAAFTPLQDHYAKVMLDQLLGKHE
jgi:hypothetical protein